jgi:hypothetical protein
MEDVRQTLNIKHNRLPPLIALTLVISSLLQACAPRTRGDGSLSTKFNENQAAMENKETKEEMLCKPFLKQATEIYRWSDPFNGEQFIVVNKNQEYRFISISTKIAIDDNRKSSIWVEVDRGRNLPNDLSCTIADDPLRTRKIGETYAEKGTCRGVSMGDYHLYEYIREGSSLSKYSASRDPAKLCLVHDDPSLYGTTERLSSALLNEIQSKM